MRMLAGESPAPMIASIGWRSASIGWKTLSIGWMCDSIGWTIASIEDGGAP